MRKKRLVREYTAERDVHGRYAFELYRDEGLSWPEIVERIGRNVFGGDAVPHKTRVNNATQHAHRYAKAHGLKLPKEEAKSIRRNKMAQRIYFDVRDRGLSMDEAAKMHSITKATAAAKANRFAREVGAPPLHIWRQRKREESAYYARLKGHSWDEVAKMTGFNFGTRAACAARKYSNREGLPWPGRHPISGSDRVAERGFESEAVLAIRRPRLPPRKK
jgi:transposase